jgi:hypothetical protein
MKRASYGSIITGLCLLFLDTADGFEGKAYQTPYGENPQADESVAVEDFVPLPPVKTSVISPNCKFRFVVYSPNSWKITKQGMGQLYRITADGEEMVWESTLPQEFGPRYSLVGNQGAVVLFDEWINVKSKYAIFLINSQQSLELSHDFDSVAKVLGEPVAKIVEQAGSGWWLQGTPRLNDAGTTAFAKAAGKYLKIDLNTGDLTLQRD